MTPQYVSQRDVPIEQIPAERLGALGYDLREQQDAYRKAIEENEHKLSLIRAEFRRRNEEVMRAEREVSSQKATEQDVIVNRVAALVAGQANYRSPEVVTETKN